MMEVREILPSLEQVNRSEHGVVIEPGPPRPLEEPTRAREPIQAIPPLEMVAKAAEEPLRPPEPPILTKVELEKSAIPELVKVEPEESATPELVKVETVKVEKTVTNLNLKEVADSVKVVEQQAKVFLINPKGRSFPIGAHCRVIRKPNLDEQEFASEIGARWVSSMDKYLDQVGDIVQTYTDKVALRFPNDNRNWFFLKTCISLEGGSIFRRQH